MHGGGSAPSCCAFTLGGFLARHDEDLREPLVRRQGLSISVSLSSHPGAIQSFAGFTDYFTAMAQEGWFPLLCVGLRPQWEDHHLQDLQDSYGQEWVTSVS